MREVLHLTIILDAFHVDGARTFFRILGVKCHGVAFSQVGETDSDQRAGMEEDIFVWSFIGSDEAKTFISQSFDFSVHVF